VYENNRNECTKTLGIRTEANDGTFQAITQSKDEPDCANERRLQLFSENWRVQWIPSSHARPPQGVNRDDFQVTRARRQALLTYAGPTIRWVRDQSLSFGVWSPTRPAWRP
jgi:hypothetical protein